VPCNLDFFIEDINADQEWTKKGYDLIRAGNLSTAVQDWHAFVEKAYQSLLPGGAFEVHDLIPLPFFDESSSADDAAKQRSQRIREAFLKFNIDPLAPLQLTQILEAVGFRDVKREVFYVDANTELELLNFAKDWFREVVDGLTKKAFRQGLRWSEVERTEFVEWWRVFYRSVGRSHFRGCFKFVVISGIRS